MTGFLIAFSGTVISVLAVLGLHALLQKDRETTEAALWPRPNLVLLDGVFDQEKAL